VTIYYSANSACILFLKNKVVKRVAKLHKFCTITIIYFRLNFVPLILDISYVISGIFNPLHHISTQDSYYIARMLLVSLKEGIKCICQAGIIVILDSVCSQRLLFLTGFIKFIAVKVLASYNELVHLKLLFQLLYLYKFYFWLFIREYLLAIIVIRIPLLCFMLNFNISMGSISELLGNNSCEIDEELVS